MRGTRCTDRIYTEHSKRPLEGSELATAIDWLQTQSEIFQDQMYNRKFQKFQQHLFSSMAASGHPMTQGTKSSEESVNAPHRANNNTATHTQRDQPQISTIESHRTDPNTATPIHLSKPTISGTEPPELTLMLWCAYSPTKRHKQPHRNDIGIHTGRCSNTKRRASHQQMVIYLLDHGLTQHETNILSKGLKFVPTPTTVNRTELTVDVKKWSHQMRLKEFYWDTHNTQQTH